MILTGKGEKRLLTKKAESDFLLWYYKQDDYQRLPFYDELTITHLHALIIEWLDSVGIYVETGVYPCQEDGNIYFSGSFFGKLGGWDDQEYYPNRQQATEKAIESAVELFNERSER